MRCNVVMQKHSNNCAMSDTQNVISKQLVACKRYNWVQGYKRINTTDYLEEDLKYPIPAEITTDIVRHNYVNRDHKSSNMKVLKLQFQMSHVYYIIKKQQHSLTQVHQPQTNTSQTISERKITWFVYVTMFISISSLHQHHQYATSWW